MPETKKEINRRYNQNNKDRISEQKRQYRLKNKEWMNKNRREQRKNKKITEKQKIKMSITSKKWAIKNREKCRESCRKYRKNNPTKNQASNARCRANRIKRIPSWLNTQHLDEIKELYRQSNKLTEITGIRHEVDHIIPLQGKNVSGLHVPWNLRVVTYSENRKKHNKLILELLDN